MVYPEQQTSGRRLFEMACIGICTLAFLFTALDVLVVMLGRETPGYRDYIEYWASGQQLMHGRNPYDPAAILQLERNAGLPSGMPAMVMGNAPPALVLTVPLGFLGAEMGQHVWTAVLVACFVLSVWLVSSSFRQGPAYVRVLGYTFAPGLACIATGQMAIFVLLGLALFLHLHKSRPFWAGAALWFLSVEAELFLPFAVVMGFSIWKRRQAKIFAGIITALALSAAVVSLMDRNCWGGRREIHAITSVYKACIPCLSIVLRDCVHGGALVQYAPAALGCVWAIAYLLAISVQHTWFIDQCIALPALLRGLHTTASRHWFSCSRLPLP